MRKQGRPAPTVLGRVVAEDQGKARDRQAALIGREGADEGIALKRIGHRGGVARID